MIISQRKAASMRRDINDRKTFHRFVGLFRYFKLLMALDFQSAHQEVVPITIEIDRFFTFIVAHHPMCTITRR